MTNSQTELYNDIAEILEIAKQVTADNYDEYDLDDRAEICKIITENIRYMEIENLDDEATRRELWDARIRIEKFEKDREIAKREQLMREAPSNLRPVFKLI